MSVAVNIGLVVLAAIALRYFFFTDSPPPPRLAQKLNSTYDYIVVGAGSAGSVVASRLSEDKDMSILLLEAGEFDGDLAQILVPGMCGLNFKGHLDWWYQTEPQNGVLSGLNENRSYWPRGKVLGGTSSINAMQYVRASRHDYDRWAQYTKDERWSYQHVLSYFKKSEDIRIPELQKSPYHGHGGPFTISHSKTIALSDKLIQAGQAAGFPYNEDYNGRTMEGISRSQVNLLNGERMAAGRAFIHPVLHRSNLDVAVRTHVTKIIIKNKRAEGVEVIKDGRKHIVMAKKEIILTAGAVGSPQILMLSGVGPRKHLDSLSIPVVADLPVGQNLQDHLFFDVGVRIREPLTTSWANFLTWKTMLQYKLFGAGPLSSPFSAEVLAFKSTTKESREKDWPDLEIYFIEIMPSEIIMNFFSYSEETKAELADRNRGDYGFICMPTLIRPESTGTITFAEVLAFKSTTKESREKDWPDLEIYFIEIMPSEIIMNFFSYSEEIPVVADLPVGQNLQDHLFFDVGVRIREPLTTSWANFLTWKTMLQYKLFGAGPLSSPFSAEVLAFKSTTKESREKDWPDLEIYFIEIMPSEIIMNFFSYSEETKAELADRNRGDYGFICMPTLIRPESTGTITLKSADPFDYPIINANYLDKQEDRELLIRGVQECRKIVNSKPMQDIGAEFTEKGPESACKQHKYDSHEYWECLIKRRPLTIYHPVGTCKMGPQGDPTAVVDSELRVQGISGLRVADASIMPWIVSGNTNAPVIMIGERAADLIRGKTMPTLDQ